MIDKRFVFMAFRLLSRLKHSSDCLLSNFLSTCNFEVNFKTKPLTIRIASTENVPSNMCAQRRFRSESSLGAFWIAKDAEFLHAGNEDSDQTARMGIADVSEGTFSHIAANINLSQLSHIVFTLNILRDKLNTVFDIITAHTPISAQSSNSVLFQITASVFSLYLFIKAYVVGTHLDCIDLSMQFKRVPATYAFIKKIRKIRISIIRQVFR